MRFKGREVMLLRKEIGVKALSVAEGNRKSKDLPERSQSRRLDWIPTCGDLWSHP